MKTDTLNVLDISAPDHGVQVEVKHDGSVVWINVDGICRMRISQIKKLVVIDKRSREVRKQQKDIPQ